jgi:hypothetical protein
MRQDTTISLYGQSSNGSLRSSASTLYLVPAPSPPPHGGTATGEMGAYLRDWYRRGGRPEGRDTPVELTISPPDGDQGHSLFALSVSSMGRNPSGGSLASGSVIVDRPDTVDSLPTISADSSRLGSPSFDYREGLTGEARSQESFMSRQSNPVPVYQEVAVPGPGPLDDSGHTVTQEGGLPLVKTTPVSLQEGEQLEFYMRFQPLRGVETQRHIAAMGYTLSHPEWSSGGLEQHVYTFKQGQHEAFDCFMANSCAHLAIAMDYFQGKSLDRLGAWTHQQELLQASISHQELQTTSQDLRPAASGSRPGHHRSFSARARVNQELSGLREAAGSG